MGNKIDKVKKYIKIITMNKSKSFFPKHKDIIKDHIENHDPTVIMFQESNLRKEDEDEVRKFFPDHEIISKFEENDDTARITILIKKNTISYERKTSLEDRNIATIWLQIKTGQKSSLMLMGGYRQ